MKTIQISKFKSSNLNPVFASITTIDIEDTPFDSGAYGEVYISKKINGQNLSIPQVVKVFIDDGSGSAKRGLDTIEQLQDQITNLNTDLKRKREKPIENIVALGAIPQFSYEGRLNGKTIIGYSANFLDGNKWLLFDKIFNEADVDKRKRYRNNFYNLSLDTRLNMAYDLAEGFYYLERMKFVYADLNPKNFFINQKDGQICLIDYEGGAVMNVKGNTPETYGKLGEWLAPEIQEQLLKNISGLIKADLHTDTWAVAIGVHFLLFPYHPLFYLKTRGEKEKEYFKNYTWPEINKNDSNYRQDTNKAYDKYLNKLKTQIPEELQKVMSETFNKGYANPNRRSSYKQWMNAIRKQMKPPTIISFKAEKQPILSGQPAKILWEVERSGTIFLNGQDVSNTREKEICLTKDEKFKLKVSNSLGSVEQELIIKVIPAPVINYFKADKTKIELGDSITLKWDISQITKLILNDGIKNIDVTKERECLVSPIQTTKYKLITTALDNRTHICNELEIEVFQKPEIVFFESEKEVILDYEEVTLKWQVRNAKSIEIDNGVGIVKDSKGKIQVKLSTSTKFTITVKGELSSTSQEAIVRIFPTPIIESLFVPMPKFESRINFSSIEPPTIDFSINMPEFNFTPPEFTELNIDLNNSEFKRPIFNFSRRYEYIKKEIKKAIKKAIKK